MKALYLTTLLTIVFSTVLMASPKDSIAKKKHQFIVVLDAGHGGHDPGNLGNGYKEKDIALKIVLGIGKILEKNETIKVVYTRKTDVFIALHERANIANRIDADLFVSVHCNSHHSDAHGTETFVLGVANTARNFEVAKRENEVIFLEDNYEAHYDGYDPNSPESVIGLTLMQEEYVDQSVKLAGLIEAHFSKNLNRLSRGVKQASLLVIRMSYMPSVLVEVGFLTNKAEGKYLNSSKGQTDMAQTISTSILQFKKELDFNVGEDVYYDLEDSTNTISEEIYNNVTFKVQLAASSTKLETKSYNFKGLSNVTREKVGNLYKYYYGGTSNYTKIKTMQEEAKAKGYTTCFIVAYKDAKKIALSKVIK